MDAIKHHPCPECGKPTLTRLCSWACYLKVALDQYDKEMKETEQDENLIKQLYK